jgi:hypothetical protein
MGQRAIRLPVDSFRPTSLSGAARMEARQAAKHAIALQRLQGGWDGYDQVLKKT